MFTFLQDLSLSILKNPLTAEVAVYHKTIQIQLQAVPRPRMTLNRIKFSLHSFLGTSDDCKLSTYGALFPAGTDRFTHQPGSSF